MAGVDLLPELSGRVDRRVDVAPQPRLRRRQGVGHVSERSVTHDEHVDVAIAAQVAACRRAEDECKADAVREWRQCLAQHVDEPGRLRQERLQLGVNRAFTVRLEVHLASLCGTSQDARLGEDPQLALNRSKSSAGLTHDLPEIEPLIGMAQEQRQDPAPCLAE